MCETYLMNQVVISFIAEGELPNLRYRRIDNAKDPHAEGRYVMAPVQILKKPEPIKKRRKR